MTNYIQQLNITIKGNQRKWQKTAKRGLRKGKKNHNWRHNNYNTQKIIKLYMTKFTFTCIVFAMTRNRKAHVQNTACKEYDYALKQNRLQTNTGVCKTTVFLTIELLSTFINFVPTVCFRAKQKWRTILTLKYNNI